MLTLAGHLLVRWPNYDQLKRLLRNFNHVDLWGTRTVLFIYFTWIVCCNLKNRGVNFVLNDWTFLIAVALFIIILFFLKLFFRLCQRHTCTQPERGGVTHTLSLSEAGSHTHSDFPRLTICVSYGRMVCQFVIDVWNSKIESIRILKISQQLASSGFWVLVSDFLGTDEKLWQFPVQGIQNQGR